MKGEIVEGRRLEDRRFLVGKASYVDDSKPPNLAFLGIVRSSYAHARITKVDFSKLAGHPDFVAAISGTEARELIANPIFEIPSDRPVRRYQLAMGKTRYVGEPVAAIVSRKKYSVEDLIELVEVEYEALPVLNTLEESKNSKTLIYEELGTNLLFEKHFQKGDAIAAIAKAPHVVEARIGIKRQAGAPIEPRCVIASYDKQSGSYDVFGTVQGAHRLRNYVSYELGIQPEKVHATVRDVGGAFGTKGAQSYPPTILACIMAKKTGLTIKWLSTRTEDLLESAQGRDQYCDIELACDSTARIVALEANIVADGGVGGTLKLQAILSSWLLPGAYKIPNIDIQCSAYVTNKTPSGPVRGAGRPEAGFCIERIVDKMARELKIDPIQFRRKNMLQPEDFPYDNGVGFTYDSANFPALIDTLVKASKYSDLIEWKRKTNSLGNGKLAGIGICLEIEDTGAQLTESARVVASARDGSITIFTGSSPHGQGHETTLALIVSRELGIPPEKVRVVWGDTSLIQSGIGTFGSRSAATGGSSALEATRKVKQLIIAGASQLLGVEPSAVKFGSGTLVVGEKGTQSIVSLGEVMKKIGKDIEAASDFKMASPTFASGAHLCALTVDSESGKVSIKRYIAVDDSGSVISQTIVDGQVHGGVAHGIGGALLEELLYDDEGQPQTSNFLSYTIPTSLDVPDVEAVHFETPSSITLDGARGVGESGTTAAFPAVFNALNDALSEFHGAKEINIAPATPEAVYRSLHAKKFKT